MGFIINTYDPCVANKMVKGKQFTVVWHVDDPKLSYEDGKEVKKVIKELEDIYGEMRIPRGGEMSTYGWT